MKKIVISLIALVVTWSSFLLAGCGGSTEAEEEMRHADARIRQIITAINNKDKESVKSTFSVWAIEETENIDIQIDNLFTYIEEEITQYEPDYINTVDSYKHHTASSSQYRVELMYGCSFSINGNKHRLRFYDYTHYNDEPTKVGLSTLNLIDEGKNRQILFIGPSKK